MTMMIKDDDVHYNEAYYDEYEDSKDICEGYQSSIPPSLTRLRFSDLMTYCGQIDNVTLQPSGIGVAVSNDSISYVRLR